MMDRHVCGSEYPNGVRTTLWSGPPANGGAPCEYVIQTESDSEQAMRAYSKRIKFQQGPMSEKLNGVLDQQLIEVVLDRKRQFQQGPYPCEQAEEQIKLLERFLALAAERRADRVKREVYSKLEK